MDFGARSLSSLVSMFFSPHKRGDVFGREEHGVIRRDGRCWPPHIFKIAVVQVRHARGHVGVKRVLDVPLQFVVHELRRERDHSGMVDDVRDCGNFNAWANQVAASGVVHYWS